MPRERRLSPLDRLISQADTALRTVATTSTASARPSPGASISKPELSEEDSQHVAGLIRVNHTGEVCAQALYQGQAVTASDPEVRKSMEISAVEEEDHLAWCNDRLLELNSHPSYLNPLWYGLSFLIGAVAGIVGDKWSLGFVVETEHQVSDHLDRHMRLLPKQDDKSRAILKQMKKDEMHHATKALKAGGRILPYPVKNAMRMTAKIMTSVAYRI